MANLLQIVVGTVPPFVKVKILPQNLSIPSIKPAITFGSVLPLGI